MKALISAKTNCGTIFAVATLSFNTVSYCYNLLKLEGEKTTVKPTQEFLIKTKNLIYYSLKIFDKNYNCYSLSKNQAFGDSYKFFFKKNELSCSVLEQFTPYNPGQQKPLLTFQKLNIIKLSQLQKYLILLTKIGLKDVLKLAIFGKYKSTPIQLINNLQSPRHTLLPKQLHEPKEIYYYVLLGVFSGSLLTLILVFFTIYFLTKIREKTIDNQEKLKQYKDIFENTGLGLIIEEETTHNAILVNPAFAEMHGYTTAELKNRPLVELLAPDCRPEMLKYIQLINEMGHHSYESKHIRKDGTVFPVWIEATAIKDSKGNVIYRIVNVEDISQPKLAEQALEETRQWLRCAVVNAPFPLIIHAENGEVLQLSDVWTQITGYSQSDIPTITEWIEKAGGKNKELLKGNIENLYNLETRIDQGEHIIITSNGETRIWDFSSAPLGKLQDGRRLVISMAKDITERKLVEEALIESEEKFRQMAENINQVFWMICPETRQLLYVSPAFERIWQTSTESLYANSRSFIDKIHPEDKKIIVESIQKPIDVNYDEEYRIIVDDGTIRWIRDRAFPVRNKQGKIYRVVGIAEDITERKQLEEMLRREAQRLEKTNRLKDEFLAVTSHELRTPLNSILGWSTLLRNRNLDEVTTAKALETIERNARVQKQLIDDLLDISRIIRGTIRLEPQRIELKNLIDQAIHTLQSTADSKEISMQFVSEVEEIFIWGDASRLQQIIWNLLSNSIKFTPHLGQVEVRLSGVTEDKNEDFSLSSSSLPFSNYAQIQVKDTGIGISAEFLPSVFEQFSQASNSGERSSGGLGLGLAIVRRLVELHKGTIWAESAGEGQGATFTVRLPMLLNSNENG